MTFKFRKKVSRSEKGDVEKKIEAVKQDVKREIEGVKKEVQGIENRLKFLEGDLPLITESVVVRP